MTEKLLKAMLNPNKQQQQVTLQFMSEMLTTELYNLNQTKMDHREG